MPVFKNEDNGSWYVMARYVNWKGERKQKCKRGFATKKEAQEWERMFQLQNSSDLDMSFEAFTELYIRDVKNRLKENTWLTKEHIIRTKILPFFGKLKISEISTKEIITWQNEMLAYRGLGSIDFQASARSVLIVGRIKDNPQVRVMAQDKSSLAPEGEAIAFELDKENGFRWLGHYDISVDDLLSGIPKEKKSEQAENLILEYLSKGKYPQQALLKKAQEAGISKRVLDEAKKALNVQSVKEGSQWYWQLPEKIE